MVVIEIVGMDRREQQLRAAMAERGRRGGSTPHKKPTGAAALSVEDRKRISALGVAARREKRMKIAVDNH